MVFTGTGTCPVRTEIMHKTLTKDRPIWVQEVIRFTSLVMKIEAKLNYNIHSKTLKSARALICDSAWPRASPVSPGGTGDSPPEPLWCLGPLLLLKTPGALRGYSPIFQSLGPYLSQVAQLTLALLGLQVIIHFHDSLSTQLPPCRPRRSCHHLTVARWGQDRMEQCLCSAQAVQL